MRSTSSADDASSTANSLRLGNAQDAAGAFYLQKMVIDLPLCNNIKFFPSIPQLEYVSKNGTQCVRLSVSVGSVLTNGRADVHEFALDMPLEAVRLVPLFTPSLLDRLHHSVAPEDALLPDSSNLVNVYGNTLTSINNVLVEDNSSPPSTALNACAWHVTVEDCQLTSVLRLQIF